MYIEIFVIAIILVFVYIYRKNTGTSSYKFIAHTLGNTYEKYAPYSFKVVQEKARELGQEYSSRQYLIQITIFGVVAAFVAYLYFYSLIELLIQYPSILLLVQKFLILFIKELLFVYSRRNTSNLYFLHLLQ